MQDMMNVMLTMFVLMAVGLVVRKLNIVGKEGQKNLTDLVIDLVLPCNIIKSFMIEFSWDTMKTFGIVLIISVCIQFVCVISGKLLYRGIPEKQQKCLQYGTICSNAGFLGNPLAEGIYGSTGLSYASIYLIPQRIMMWSAGISIFTESPSKKELVKKVLTHPCIVACIIGVILMVTGLPLPGFLVTSISAISSCNTALSMMIIGMILAQVNYRKLLNWKVLYYTVIRLAVLPFLVYLPLHLLHTDTIVTGLCVILCAMPAGATTSILASKYDGDAEFATSMVVFSTLASLVSTPVWSLVIHA